MKFSSDFECGNGGHFVPVGPLDCSLNVVGDRPGYDHFFFFRVDVGDEEGLLRIHVLPPVETEVGSEPFELPWANPPRVIWRRHGTDGAWERMRPDEVAVAPGCVTLRQAVRPLDVWYFAEACPFPYSDMMRHVQALPSSCPHVQSVNLGESVENRPLVVARITDPEVPNAEKGKVFVIAGQHGIEFAGMYAAKGTLDFLASDLPHAAALRRRYVFDILPCANPDGCAHGMGCHNATGEDQLEAFEHDDGGANPVTHEAELIWQHLMLNPPDLILHFHSYAHPRAFGDPPYEGIYVPDPERLNADDRRRMQGIINHAMFYLTDGGSQHRRPCPQLANTLEDAAAATWQSLSVLYQVQAERGPHANLRTGIRVLRTLVDTLELAQDEDIGLG